MKYHIENVCACDAQTRYECGGMALPCCEYARAARVASVALCESRHEIPGATDGSIFPNTVDPTRVGALETYAIQTIAEANIERLTVYVTGLTVALVAVINACRFCGVDLTLMHYDRETGKYYPQHVRGEG